MRTVVSYENHTDEELVEQIVKTKNAVLFGVLFDRYSKVVYNKCYSFAMDTEEAQDLAQDVFLKLFIKLGSFKGQSKFSTWLYAFTYNYCVNYIQRDVAKKIKNNAITFEQYDLPQTEYDESSLFELEISKLKKALEIISPEDKMILLLKYQDDFSIKELSEALVIGESAVKMRLKRARYKVVEAYNNL